MKFEDIIFLIQTGTALAGIATGNPGIGAFGELGARLMRAGHDAYVSGRSRAEWTPEQEQHFDEVVLPTMLAQPHWQKR